MTTRPDFFSRIPGKNARVQRTADNRFNSCKSRQSSSLMYRKLRDGDAPTLLMRMSTGPESRTRRMNSSVDF